MKKRFETFTVLITKINRSIRKIKNQEMAEYNLKSPQISCLYHLYLSDGLTATELCERCEEDKATISRSLDVLEKSGYIVCETAGTKRYKSPLMLTERGKAVGEKIVDKVNRVLDAVGDGMSEDERITFYQHLTAICENLEHISNGQH